MVIKYITMEKRYSYAITGIRVQRKMYLLTKLLVSLQGLRRANSPRMIVIPRTMIVMITIDSKMTLEQRKYQDTTDLEEKATIEISSVPSMLLIWAVLITISPIIPMENIEMRKMKIKKLLLQTKLTLP